MIKKNSVFKRILPELVLRLDTTPYFADELQTTDKCHQKQNSCMSGAEVVRKTNLPWSVKKRGGGGEKNQPTR